MASGYPRGRDQHNRVHLPEQSCRSCKRRMLWVTMPSGKRNPLDLDRHAGDPAPDVIVIDREHRSGAGPRWRVGVVLRDEELIAEARELGLTLYTSHFATCPNADDHRRPARERADLA